MQEGGDSAGRGNSMSTVLYCHIISIHHKQLITREELPETKQVV